MKPTPGLSAFLGRGMRIRLSVLQRFVLSLAALILALCITRAAGDEPLGIGIINSPTEGRFNIRLTVSERFGSERYQERVVGGVPFPRGTLKDVGGLYVVNAMQMQLKSRFRPLSWWPDGSVRWALAEFQTDMLYPTIEEFFVREATRRRAKKPDRRFFSTLAAEDDGEAIIVDTGVIRFVVRKKNFDLISKVWVDDTGSRDYTDETLVVRDGGLLTVRDGAGKVYSAANDPGIKVELEHRTLMHATIRVAGKHADEAGKPLVDFVLRITAAENSNQLTMEYTLLNATDKPVELGDIAARVSRRPTTDASVRFLFGTNGSPISGAITAGSQPDEAALLVSSPDLFVAEGAAARPGNRIVRGVPRFGDAAQLGYGRVWTSASGTLIPGDYGITAGMRELWERSPAELRVGPLYGAGVRCHPAAEGKPGPAVRLLPGMKLGYVFGFSFSGHKPRHGEDWATFRSPLRATCDPLWYCVDASAFGRLAPAKQELYDGEAWLDVRAFDRHFRKSFDALLAARRWADGVSPYNSLHYGDFVEGIRRPEGGQPEIAWSRNTFDLAHTLMLQFARTGDTAYLDVALEAARHAQERTVAWAGPAEGARRAAPSTEFGNPDTQTLDHCWTQGIFDRYCLTGDPESREAVLLCARHVLGRGPDGVAGVRSLGAALGTLLCGFAVAANREFLDAALTLAKAKADVLAVAAKDCSPGLAPAADAYGQLYEMTGDAGIRDALLAAAKAALTSNKADKESTLVLLDFAWREAADPAARAAGDAVFKNMPPLTTSGSALARSGSARLRYARSLSKIDAIYPNRARPGAAAGEVEIDLGQ